MTYSTEIDKSGFEKGLNSLNSISSVASKAIKMAIGGIVTAITGIGTYAIKVGSDFEAGMSKVQAISGATGEEIEKLTEKAKEMGQKTKFSATESAEAFQYMAMAGWKTEDMLNGIDGIMNLAAASGEDLASVSDIVTDALTAFGLQAKDSGHFADVLAKASSNSNTNVGLMGETFKYVAPLAGSMKYSVEDTAVAIGLMANAGIKGSQAGTALRSMLTRLVKPPKEAAQALTALNISAKNSDGTMKPLSQTLQELRKKFSKLSDSQKSSYAASIAGQEAMSGMLAIVNASDNDFDKLTESINNADGASKEMADTMNDNVQGAFTLLKSNVESVGIKLYDKIKEPLKKLINVVSEYVSRIPEILSNLYNKYGTKIITLLKNLYNWTNKNKDLIKSLIKVVASLTAGYLAYKAVLVAINAIQMAKNILGTVSAFLSLIPTIKSAKDMMLLLNMTFSANPIGLVVAGVVALTTAFIAFSATQGTVKKTMENVASGFKEFYDGINNANSYLESFNSTLFASSEEQQKLQEDMNNVQQGITEICKRASDERRDYTQEEITQLDEYFNKLRELKNRELEIQKSISGAITQQAQQEAQAFQGTLEEYKVKSQEWIKTAEEQKDKQISIINDRTTQEIALLQQKYGEKANLDNEEYAREYNVIQENKEKAIQEANDEVAKVTEAYNNGYIERANQEEGFFTKLTEANAKIEEENNRHSGKLEEIENNIVTGQEDIDRAKIDAGYVHNEKMKKIWEEMYKNMSEEEAEELGSWLARQTQVELYGGKISDKNQEMVDTILKSYENMPDGAKNKMKETMSGMLKGMEDDEPSLYAKASGIAGGILERLKKSFDINSPSKKTRQIFKYVMEGAELGLEDEKSDLMKQIDEISNDFIYKMQNAVAMETASVTAKASVKANNSMLNVIQANFNIDGSIDIDGQKAGRILAPNITKTIKVGGLA